MKTQACAFHGAKTLLHACLAQPGELMLRCTSPGCRPIQYIVDRCPTGYEACVCSTSFGCAVVPDVKYSSSVSSARVATSGSNVSRCSKLLPYDSQPRTSSPTAMRVHDPGTSANFPVSAERVTTCAT